MNKAARILISVLCGVVILVITWMYQNYDYTLALEDAFFKKIFMVRDKVLSPAPDRKAEFVFINTGKDLALVEDTVEYGNVAISDREKIHRLLRYMNAQAEKPLACVLDIQFYYPFTANPETDKMLQAELRKYPAVIIPILKGGGGNYKPPIYSASYGHSDYRTFSANFNKFRIIIHDDVQSIPIAIHTQANGAKYANNFLFPRYNGRLCLSSIWPTYYLKDDSLTKSFPGEDLASAESTAAQGTRMAQYYNLGELLLDVENSDEPRADIFKNKIVIIGNFQEDVHVTPVGKMAGPVLLANIYLSLLNEQHVMSVWLILLMVAAFSALSYIAVFKKMPEINLKFSFLFSSYLSKFLKGYISYFGAMFFVSLIALLLFNVQIALFLPSVIFTGIEYIKEKKYLELKK